MNITREQARRFLLRKHGLLGEHRFAGKEGAMAFVRQVGCVQFDPIDACGKNAELVLQSRVKGFRKPMLESLLYKDRLLVDYPDKQLSIFPVEDWPYFECYRHQSREHGKQYPAMEALTTQVRAHITRHGPVSSGDIQLEGDFHWRSAIHWSGGDNLSRSVLEQMYSTGDLVIHHKNGTRKFYDLAERHIPAELLNSPDPLPDEADHLRWRVLRRIGAVGMLWNRPSDAWLGIQGLNAAARNEIFPRLLAENKIVAFGVEGFKNPFYCRSEDIPLLEEVCRNEKYRHRCELIAPLDNFLWDRQLIRALFGFHYHWEIYTPIVQRKYGYYVLPLLYGEGFAGRVEAVADRKTGTLVLKNIWLESGVRKTKKLEAALESCLKRFARFNNCTERAGSVAELLDAKQDR